MSNATTRQNIIDQLYKKYKTIGFITEDEVLSCFVAHKSALSEIDSITEYLLTLGVIIKIEEDSDEDEFIANDRSKLDYEKIFNKVLLVQPELETFIEYVRQITPPQNREWQSLIPQAQNGNTYARNRLVEMYLRVVIKQALYCFKNYKVSLEDTLQNGVIGLITAIKKYNPAKHEKFSTYAPWWINQSIYRRMKIYNNPMYFPFHIKDKVLVVQKMIKKHHNSNCSCTSSYLCDLFLDEVQEKLNCQIEDAKQILFYLNQFFIIDSIDSEDFEFNDKNLCTDELTSLAERIHTRQVIRKAFKGLQGREHMILRFRFGFFDGEPWTLEQIGLKFGVTRERVRQIETSALRRLKNILQVDRI